MFCRSESFNKSLNNWNIENVKDMSYMFADSFSFEQELNDFNNWNDRGTDIFDNSLYFDEFINI